MYALYLDFIFSPRLSFNVSFYKERQIFSFLKSLVLKTSWCCSILGTKCNEACLQICNLNTNLFFTDFGLFVCLFVWFPSKNLALVETGDREGSSSDEKIDSHEEEDSDVDEIKLNNNTTVTEENFVIRTTKTKKQQPVIEEIKTVTNGKARKKTNKKKRRKWLELVLPVSSPLVPALGCVQSPYPTTWGTVA